MSATQRKQLLKKKQTNSAVNMYVIRISDSLVNSLCMSRQKPVESSSPPPVAPRQGRLYDLFRLALVGRGFPCRLSACLMAFASPLCCNTYWGWGGNHNTKNERVKKTEAGKYAC